MDTSSATAWEHARHFLLTARSDWLDPSDQDCLTLALPDEDWLLEIRADGTLVCMAGYALEDMRSILCDGTTEDLGSDELAKQAKFYLQQTVSKHRPRLLAQGFTERIEMNDEFVAAHFERSIDLTDTEGLARDIRQYREAFS